MVHLVIDLSKGRMVVAAVSSASKAETFRQGYAREIYYRLPEQKRLDAVIVESHKVIGEGFGK